MTRRAAIVLVSIVALIGAGVGVALLSEGDGKPAPVPEVAAVDRLTPDDGAQPRVARRPSRDSVLGEVFANIIEKRGHGEVPTSARRELRRKLSQPGSTGCESVEVGKKRSIGLCVATAGPPGD